MKRLTSILCCTLVILLLATTALAAGSVPKPVMDATRSVVRVLADYPDGYSTGSGFVVKSDKESTLIVTNYHVVEGNPRNISIWIEKNETISATILARSEQKDLCVLQLSSPVKLDPLVLANESARQGDAVYAVGFPAAADILSDTAARASADATITDGIISALRKATVVEHGDPISILQISAAINSGNSGGPLFNVNGEVVGINTYGIADAQGIFGAIDVSELKSLLDSNAITVAGKKSTTIWIVSLLLASVGVVILVIWLRRRGVLSSKRHQKVTLREYMVQHPNGISMHQATAMLLPLALQLRDAHNNGNPHLQISPDSIFVSPNGATLTPPTNSEADRYTNGFAAPEIYQNKSRGSISDIYSFCATLYFVAFGHQPDNALTRESSQIPTPVENCDPSFLKIIEKGMMLDAEERFESMQEVIVQIAAYNNGPFICDISAVKTTTAVRTRKMKRPSKKQVMLCGTAVLILLLVIYFGSYTGAYLFAQNDAFASADKCLLLPEVTRLHSPKLVSYIEAGQLMLAQKYDDAKARFIDLSGYFNADELVMEADYLHAAQYADSNDFGHAIQLFSSLAKKKYKDSEAKVFDTQYRQGLYLLYEEDYAMAARIFLTLSRQNYKDAQEMEKEVQYQWAMSMVEHELYVDAYSKLKPLRGYSDVNDLIKTLTEIIYIKGQMLYRSGEYDSAYSYFHCISSYKDCANYLTLIEGRTALNYSGSAARNKALAEKIEEIFYFEDAAKVLLCNNSMFTSFLQGTWRGDGFYFTMKKDHHTSYSLPYFDYGDYYTIEDGCYLLYPKNNEKAAKRLFQFNAISPDSIEVYCYKNGKTYILNRQ